jgi:ankyrin repeat protein
MPDKRLRIEHSPATLKMLKAATSNPTEWNVISACIREGADVNAGDVFIKACSWRTHDAYRVAIQLYKAGASTDVVITNPDAPCYGADPVYLAAAFSNFELLSLLVQDGADVNTTCLDKDYRGMTALCWCVNHRNLKAVSELLAYGANVNIYYRDLSYYSRPLIFELATIKFSKEEDQITKWELVLQMASKGAPIDAYIKTKSYSVLEFAISSSEISFALKLIKAANYKPGATKSNFLLFILMENTPLYYNSPKKIKTDLKNLILTLLDGREITEVFDPSLGMTLLQWAIDQNDKNMVQFMYSHWPQLLKTRSQNGENCLFFIRHLAIDMCEWLLSIEPDVNKLDNYGNSALWVLSVHNKKNTIDLLLEHGAKCIRNGKEIYSSLHFLAAGDTCSLSRNLRSQALNQQDPDGRTPLHYSILFDRASAVELITKHKAKSHIPDVYGRTAFHHALLEDDFELIKAMSAQSLNMRDKLGLSSYIMACYSRNRGLMDYIINHANYVPTTLDKAISKHRGVICAKHLNKFSSVEEMLIFVSALLSSKTGVIINDRVREKINRLLSAPFAKQSLTDFLPGRAFGIELEFANLPNVSLIPRSYLIDFFNLNQKTDRSVASGHFMCTPEHITELVSEIISTPQKLNKFLRACKYLHAAGAKANNSTGLHVHVNINGGDEGVVGYIDDCFASTGYCREQVRLNIIKQILLNWSHVEVILQGFLRNGEYYNLSNNSNNYIAINPFIDKLLKCESIENMQKLYVDFPSPTTLSVLSLYSSTNTSHRTQHGTLEFRFHQGTANPTLIAAWLNFIARLVDISVKQIQQQVEQKAKLKVVAYPGIEHLVYMLIAERRYQDTWDADWGSERSMDYYPSDSNVQQQIQIAPLYRLYQAKASGEKITLPQDKNCKKDLQAMLELRHKHPGLINSL